MFIYSAIMKLEMITNEEALQRLELSRHTARRHVERLKREGKLFYTEGKSGLPSVMINRRTLPEAWEDGIMALMAIGTQRHTHYDRKGEKGEYENFPSLEATAVMHIEEPFSEPRLHLAYLGGWWGLGDYKAEIEGVKDHWMISPEEVVRSIKAGEFDKRWGDERWKYTYSQRLRTYSFLDISGNPCSINQLEQVVEALKRDPTSKSAQAITWDPRFDYNDGQIKDHQGNPIIWRNGYHAPCLQRLWFRLYETTGKKGFVLHTNAHWRSRDHLKAVPQNIFGITEGVIEPLRLRLQEELGVEVERGPYRDISDSLHLYGNYMDLRKSASDAGAFFRLVDMIESGEPIERRLMIPGKPMHDIAMDHIAKEYAWRKAHNQVTDILPTSFD